jgi:hypothetical protein
MKTLLVKSFLPVAAFMLASAGAVSTSTSGTTSRPATVQGFIRIAPFNCQFVKMCNNIGSITCEDNLQTPLLGKATPQSDCLVPLTHRPPN